jgi:TPP-dependent indolepyruvate ferredoxin oxidoreductase alpha subunit
VLKLKNSLQDWKSLSAPEIPHLPEGLPDKWKPAAAAYQNLFTVFRTLRGPLVVGDTGISALFACEPYNCIDITTYMGGSIPLATGAYLAGTRDVWAVTGDFSFIAAGHLGLLEALQRGIPLKVLIFYNGKAETTGGQIIPENILETVLSGYSRYILRINNPDDPAEVESVLNEAKNVGEMRIVVADYRKKR